MLKINIQISLNIINWIKGKTLSSIEAITIFILAGGTESVIFVYHFFYIFNYSKLFTRVCRRSIWIWILNFYVYLVGTKFIIVKVSIIIKGFFNAAYILNSADSD